MVPKETSQPNTLSEALDNPKLQLMVSNGSNMHTLLSSSKAGIYCEAWKRIEPYPENIISAKDFPENGLSRIEGSSTPLGLLTQKEFATRYIASHPDSQLYVVKQHLFTNLGMFTYKKGFIHADLFNEEIARLEETGKIDVT